MTRKTSEDPKAPPHPNDWGPRIFSTLQPGIYRLALPGATVALTLDRLRRERSELHGELSVTCEFAGARTIDGTLTVADFNCSSAAMRMSRAKMLRERSLVDDIDWEGLIEELCQKVIIAERTGQPAVALAEVDEPADDYGELEIGGFPLPQHHPLILFGDGGTAKSYFALYLAGLLADEGKRVLYADWEATAPDHRARLGRLFPVKLPAGLLYARCELPLAAEVDRLRRLIHEWSVTYLVIDSIAYACAGPPESAEAAMGLFQAVRRLGQIGTLAIAHVTKQEGVDKTKPFGSAFFANSARSTWNIERTDTDDGADEMVIFLKQCKSNLGRLRMPLAYRVHFSSTRTTFSPSDPTDTDQFAAKMSLKTRLTSLLKRGAFTVAELAEETGKPANNIRTTLERATDRFVRLSGKPVKFGLKSHVG